jgi:drug/metabolite transporter (DMT)-like permease
MLACAFVLVWSSGYVSGALAVDRNPPLAVTFWRFVVAGIALAVVARLRHEVWPNGRQLAAVAGTGVVIFGVQFGCLYWGMARGVSAGTTALIACSSPMMVAVLSVSVGWERLRGRQWCGVGLGVAGVAVTMTERASRPPHLLDLGWTALGLLGLAVGTMLQGRLRVDSGPMAVAATELLAAAVVIGCAAWPGGLDLYMEGRSLGSFVWLAVVAGAGGPVLLLALISARGALWTSSLLFVVPGITTVASGPYLDEPVGPAALAGLAIAGIGLLLTLRAGLARAPSTKSAHRRMFRSADGETLAATTQADSTRYQS